MSSLIDMHILLFSTDLMIISQVTSAARNRDAVLMTAGTIEQFRERLQEDAPRLVLLDLEARAMNVDSVVSEVRSAPLDARVVAFGPHVWTNRLQAAEASGCDAVFSRGQFTRELHGLFAD